MDPQTDGMGVDSQAEAKEIVQLLEVLTIAEAPPDLNATKVLMEDITLVGVNPQLIENP
jgi:hypothetical protein